MDERKEKARQLRLEGKALKDIAATLAISVATASAYCRDALPKGKNAPGAQKLRYAERFKKMYSDGMPIPEIAKVFGIPASTLFDWRREFGLKRNSRSRYMTDDMREHLGMKLTRDKTGVLKLKAVRLYLDDELSTPEIAQQLGVSAQTIGQWLIKADVVLRQRPTTRTRQKLRQANLGEKRYNWKGGITREQQRRRGSLYMRLAREACFERDDYTCRSCGEKGGTLNAHHIWPFQRFPDRMYDVNNLLTLCEACHTAFHKAVGGHVKVAIGPFYAETKWHETNK